MSIDEVIKNAIDDILKEVDILTTEINVYIHDNIKSSVHVTITNVMQIVKTRRLVAKYIEGLNGFEYFIHLDKSHIDEH